MAVCDGHDLRSLTTFCLPDFEAPFLAEAKLPSMKASSTSRAPRALRSKARVSRIPFITPRADPPLKSSVASLVGRITLGNIGPRSAGAQHPENTVQHSATIFPRSPSSISATHWFRDKVIHHFPLHVREVSSICERHGIPVRDSALRSQS
jgi:hypothetical protein